MVDGGTHNLHLSRGKVPLEIGVIVKGIPEAPLHKGKEGERAFPVAVVGQFHPLHLALISHRNHVKHFGFQLVHFPANPCISHPMPALIAVQFGFDRLPPGRPNLPVLVDIKILAPIIHRYIVVPVAGDPAQACILVKAVASCRIGDNGEKFLTTQVVDPGIGGAGLVITYSLFWSSKCPNFISLI